MAINNIRIWHIFVEKFCYYKIMPYICNIKIRDNKSNNKIKNYGKRKFDWFRKK